MCINLDFFFSIIFQFSPCMGHSEIVPGQSELNKKITKNKFYFLKFKLIHVHQCYIPITYCKKYYTDSCLGYKTQVNATCDDSSSPAQSSH